jgi:autotransporter-associated beta strand protein
MNAMSSKLIAAGCAILTAVQTSGAATHTWTGGGTTAFWSEAANWNGSNPPQPGESGAGLIFPSGSLRLSSTNDLPGLAIAQLAFAGANYVLNGTNALILSPAVGDSITATGNSNQVAIPLILQATNSFSIATNASLSLSGQLSGPGAFTLSGSGLLVLAPAGGVDNTYQGTTRVPAGTLQLQSGYTNVPFFGGSVYAVAVPGDIIVGDTNSLAPASLTGLATSTNTGVTLLGLGQYLGQGVIGSLAGDGTIDSKRLDLKVGGNNRSTAFSGQITNSLGGAGALFLKAGTGTLTLTAGSGGSAELDVTGGTLVVDGNFTNSTADVFGPVSGLIAGGRLEGTGALQMIYAAGPFSPGHDDPGQLTATMVNMDLGSILAMKLGGTNAGIDYDQLVAKQSFGLIDPRAALEVQMLPGFVGAVGNRYTIVRLDSTNAIGMPQVPLGNTNGFNGLGEGSILSLTNGAAFRISYKGGDGNDIVLTQVAARPILNPPSVQADGNILLSGIGSPGANYDVQARTTLDAPSGWLVLGTALAQTDGSLSFVHTNAELSSPQLYYRLHAP